MQPLTERPTTEQTAIPAELLLELSRAKELIRSAKLTANQEEAIRTALDDFSRSGDKTSLQAGAFNNYRDTVYQDRYQDTAYDDHYADTPSYRDAAR